MLKLQTGKKFIKLFKTKEEKNLNRSSKSEFRTEAVKVDLT